MTLAITRTKLIKQIQKALADGHVIVAAPAGFGKTMLLQQLAAQRINTHLFPLTVADTDVAGLRARLEPLMRSNHTLFLDDVHHLADSVALAWLREEIEKQTDEALAELETLSREPDVALYASQTYAMVLADRGHFFQEAAVLRQAIVLAESQGELERVWRMRAFVALIALLPMGRFGQAAAYFDGALDYFANEPGRQLQRGRPALRNSAGPRPLLAAAPPGKAGGGNGPSRDGAGKAARFSPLSRFAGFGA